MDVKTVGELINALKKYPADMSVMTTRDDGELVGIEVVKVNYYLEHGSKYVTYYPILKTNGECVLIL